MEIKFGSIEYFSLIGIELKLKWMERDCNKIGLISYDKFRTEVDIKIKQIQHAHKHKNDCPTCDGHGIVENSYMTCDFCKGTGKRFNPTPKAK